MPRKKFVIAPDAARRRVDCAKFSFNGGAPRCDVLNHPWCLAPGQAPETCAFRKPKETVTAAEGVPQGRIVFFEEDGSGKIVDAAGAGEADLVETESKPAPEEETAADAPAETTADAPGETPRPSRTRKASNGEAD